MERHVLKTWMGGVEVVTDQGRLRELHFTRAKPTRGTLGVIDREILEYFQGKRQDLRDIPVDLSGLTPFERSVLEATRHIPFGKVATYAQIARAIGHPRAQRAVGNALGKSPIDIVIPCHRVIALDGLGGYGGGLEGLKLKKELLRFERVLP